MRSKYMQAVPKFKHSDPGPDHARLRVFFVMCEIGLAKICSCTKFDVSSFTYSRYMEEDLNSKFGHWTHDYAPFGGILSRMRWDLPRSIHIPNLKLILASSVTKGSKI